MTERYRKWRKKRALENENPVGVLQRASKEFRARSGTHIPLPSYENQWEICGDLQDNCSCFLKGVTYPDWGDSREESSGRKASIEISKPNDQQSGILKPDEKFEIDEHEFHEIQVDNNRVIAKGKGL